MKFRIIAVTLLAFLFSPPAIADIDYATIGGLRKSCKAFLNDDPSVAYADKGACLGWVISEVNWRYAACVFFDADNPSKFVFNAARDGTGHSYEALIQSFVNWTNKNPDAWAENLYFLSINPDVWAEFPCD